MQALASVRELSRWPHALTTVETSSQRLFLALSGYFLDHIGKPALPSPKSLIM